MSIHILLLALAFIEPLKIDPCTGHSYNLDLTLIHHVRTAPISVAIEKKITENSANFECEINDEGIIDAKCILNIAWIKLAH